jgi:hypothetical protein
MANIEEYSEHILADVRQQMRICIKRRQLSPRRAATDSVQRLFSYRQLREYIPKFARPGDWLCARHGCYNLNFSYRPKCKKCETVKPDV